MPNYGSLGIAGAPDLTHAATVADTGPVLPPPPPPAGSGGGGPGTPGTGYAPADAAYILDSADARLPNGLPYAGPIVEQSTPPTDTRTLWADTSAVPAVVKYYDVSSATWLDVAPQADASVLTPLTADFVAGVASAGGLVCYVGSTVNMAIGMSRVIFDVTGAAAYYVITAISAPGSTPSVTLTREAWDTAVASSYAFTVTDHSYCAITGAAAGGGGSDTDTAATVSYDNSASMIAATNVQGAIDSIAQIALAGSALIAGGIVTFAGGGYNYSVSPSIFHIGPTLGSTAATSVSLSVADPLLDRIDVIAVTATNTVEVITGTPAVNPITPQIEPSAGIALTAIPVRAGSSGPSVTTTTLYREDAGTVGGEWNASTNQTSQINVASTSSPLDGSVSIEATGAAANTYVQLLAAAPGVVSYSSSAVLTFKIRSKANFGTLQLRLFPLNSTGSATIGTGVNVGVYGFMSTVTTSVQTISIPVSVLGAGTLAVGGLRFVVRQTVSSGGTASAGFWLDDITITDTSGTGGSGGSGGASDHKVAVQASDGAPGYLADKIETDSTMMATLGTDVTGNQTLQLSAAAALGKITTDRNGGIVVQRSTGNVTYSR